jgi:type IV pilus assembly protein PilQ
MDLVVNNDTVGERFGSGALDVPSIDTREVSTQVLVNNGETVVLGGVYQQVSRNEVNRVPFFSDLPLVGVLFRNTEVEDDKTELLVFVTPKIIKESIGTTASY